MAHHSPLFLSIATVAILVELIWRLRTGRGYDGRAALTTAGLVAGNLVAGALHVTVLAKAFGFVWTQVPHHFPADQWHSWALGFFAVEFAYYWFHRASHEVRWLWASHNVHHSAEQLTFLSSLRLGWTNTLSLGWLIYLPVIAIGFDPSIVAVLLAINLHYQFFLHSEAIPRLGLLEWVFNTPHHHRAHHASNPEFLDRNYGGMLIMWDRLFGTIAPENDVIKRYGLVGKAREDNPFRVALREWRLIIVDFHNARGWKGRRASLVRMTGSGKEDILKPVPSTRSLSSSRPWQDKPCDGKLPLPTARSGEAAISDRLPVTGIGQIGQFRASRTQKFAAE